MRVEAKLPRYYFGLLKPRVPAVSTDHLSSVSTRVTNDSYITDLDVTHNSYNLQIHKS